MPYALTPPHLAHTPHLSFYLLLPLLPPSYSTGISLEFLVPTGACEGLLRSLPALAGPPAVPAPCDEAKGAGAGAATDGTTGQDVSCTSTQLHLGNLPMHPPASTEAVAAALAHVGIKPASLLVRPKRGFAFLCFPDAPSAVAAMRAWAPGCVVLQGRALTLAPRGSTARLQLRELCRSRHWGPPKFIAG